MSLRFFLFLVCITAFGLSGRGQKPVHTLQQKEDLKAFGDSIIKHSEEFINKNKYEEAFETLAIGLIALDEHRELDQWVLLTHTKGQLQKLLGRQKEALHTYLSVLPVLKESELLAKTYNRISACFVELNCDDSILYYVQKSESVLARLDTKIPYLESWNLHLKGVGYMSSRPDSARIYLNKAYKTARFVDTSNTTIILSQIASLEKSQGHIELASNLYQLAVNEAIAKGAIINHLWVMDELAKTYKQLGKNGLAYETVYLRDSLNNLINPIKLVAALDGMNEQVNIARIEKARLELESQKKIAEDHTYFAYTCLFLVGLVCLLLLRTLVKVRKQKQLLTNAHQELDALADGLSKKAVELKASNAHKDMLLGVIGHDVRAPLANLKGLIGLLNMGAIKKDEMATLLSKIEYDVDEARNLLDDLLLWAKSQMHGLKPDSHTEYVHNILANVLRQQQPLAQSRNVEFDVKSTGPLRVWVDERLLKIVIRNLVANAIQNSPVGARVVIAYERVDTHCKIQITNDDSIMPESSRLILIDKEAKTLPLHKAGDASKGFGLVLIRDFLNILNGYAEVTTSEAGGTSVSIFIPKPTADQLAEADTIVLNEA